MPSLPNLPTELLDAIITHLSRKSKLKLSKTCKTINTASLPHLYHTIRLMWKVDNKPTKQPRITSLLRTIVARPDLAAAIKAIDFKATGYTARTEGKLSSPKRIHSLIDDDVQAANHILSEAKVPERPKWDSALKEKDLDAIIALVLSQCTNIQFLSLGAYFLYANAFLPSLLAHAINPPRGAELTGLSKLEHVRLGVDMDEYTCDSVFFLDFSMSTSLPLFYLPTLKSAYIMPPTTWRPFEWTLPTPPRATQLSDLRLKRSRATAEVVAKMLDVCPNLHSFEYDYRPNVGGKRLDCDVLIQALKNYESSLKHLRICLLPYSSNTLMTWEFGETEYQDGRIGDGLKLFTALETLEVGLAVLLGWEAVSAMPLSDVLPKNLKTLTIRDDCWRYEGWEWSDKEYLKLFYVFLKHDRWRDTCPDLQVINLRLDQSMEDDWALESREKFRKMCSVKGVEGRVSKARRDEDEDVKTGDRCEERVVELGTFFDE